MATSKSNSAKKAPAKKSAPAAATKKAAPAKKAPAKKAPAKPVPAAKAPAKKSTPAPVAKKTAPAKKAPVKKTPAAKSTATVPAKKDAPAAPAKDAAKKAVLPAPSPVGSVLGALPRLGKNAPPRLTKSPYDAKFLESQRALLLKERAAYSHQADALLEEAQALTANREPGDVQFDEESGEGDTLAVERDQDLELSARARATVDDIDLALERIDAGVYGICAGSGQAIPKERLKAIPWATERVEYKVGGFGRL